MEWNGEEGVMVDGGGRSQGREGEGKGKSLIGCVAGRKRSRKSSEGYESEAPVGERQRRSELKGKKRKREESKGGKKKLERMGL